MKKSLVGIAVMAYLSAHPSYAQTQGPATLPPTTSPLSKPNVTPSTPSNPKRANVFKSDKLSPLPLESKRGDFQLQHFDAFDVPEYKLNDAYLEKSKQENYDFGRTTQSVFQFRQSTLRHFVPYVRTSLDDRKNGLLPTNGKLQRAIRFIHEQKTANQAG